MGVALHPSHGHSHGGAGHGHGHSHKSAPSTPTLPTKTASSTSPAMVEAGTETQPTSQTIVATSPQQRTTHHSNLNVRAAFIHVIGDLLQSIGVFIAALTIYFKVS